jgi:hypothetical protein
MINIIPNWLTDAVHFLDDIFPYDEDVNMSILYGFDSVGTDKDNCGFAVYNTESKSIFLADYNELKKSFEELSWDDIRYATIIDLFHEYRHHQQNIYGWDLSENDAEKFANDMYELMISDPIFGEVDYYG